MNDRQQDVVVLRLGDEETTLARGAAGITLAIGARRLADERFAHSPPTPLELENAIMVVEDEIARATAFAGVGLAVLSDDGALRDLADFAGVSGDALSVGAVENAFERLAASAGLPAGDSGRTFAAKLLIVRELMHHLGFAEIAVGG